MALLESKPDPVVRAVDRPLDRPAPDPARSLDALPTPSRRSRPPLGQVVTVRRAPGAVASKTLSNSHRQTSPRPSASSAAAGRALVQRTGARPAARRPSAPEPSGGPAHRSMRSLKTFSEGPSVPAQSGRPAGASGRPSKNPLDPFNIERFAEAQKENGTFDRALGEIQNGRKSSCWMWFVIPSPPYVKNNIERGSGMNRKYAIRSDEEAKAFLNYESDGVDLRQNYFSILSAVLEHLKAGRGAKSVIGGFDEPKLGSSVAFFERITRGNDQELNDVLVQMAKLMNLPLAK